MGRPFDPYAILGVPRGATKDAVEAAWKGEHEENVEHVVNSNY